MAFSIHTKLTAIIALTGALFVSACGENADSSSNSGGVGSELAGKIETDRSIGDPNAPITMIEYASVTCPACANFHAIVYPELKEEYIDTGKVHFIFREFPTPPVDRAYAGFMLARCMPEDRYFGFIDVLFKQQAVWVSAQDSASELLKIGRMGGMTAEQFNACMQDQEEIERIEQVVEDGQNVFGISATPTFVINGTTYAGRSFEDFKQVLDPLLAE